jgi:hypothetical protein
LPHLEVVIGYIGCTARRVSKNSNFAAGVGGIGKLDNRLLINVERDLVAVCCNANRVNLVEPSGKPRDLASLYDTRVGADPVDRDLEIVIPRYSLLITTSDFSTHITSLVCCGRECAVRTEGFSARRGNEGTSSVLRRRR